MHYYTGKNQGNGWGRPETSCAASGMCRRRPVVARSAFMRSEEIDQERAMSGWNPYYGEEEMIPQEGMQPGMRERMAPDMQPGMQGRMAPDMQPGMQGRMAPDIQPGTGERMQPGMRERTAPEMQPEMQEGMMPEMRPGTSEQTTEIMQPYFMQPDYAQVLEEQKMAERDLRMLQSMYPETAKMLLPYIEEECDKMEYEGSTMYDEYPDPTTVQRLEQRIYDQVKDRLPETMVQPEQMPEDILSMQYQGNRRSRPGRNWPNDLIRILLLQEMHHRRCRHRGCRRGRF